jgi:hypothetical protein
MITHSNYNCRVTTQDGEQHLVYGNWLHNQKLDAWRGFRCDAGATRFHIDKNFDIWSGECKNDHLGNMLTDWSPRLDVICQQDYCSGCTDDLIVSKHKQ